MPSISVAASIRCLHLDLALGLASRSRSQASFFRSSLRALRCDRFISLLKRSEGAGRSRRPRVVWAPCTPLRGTCRPRRGQSLAASSWPGRVADPLRAFVLHRPGAGMMFTRRLAPRACRSPCGDHGSCTDLPSPCRLRWSSRLSQVRLWGPACPRGVPPFYDMTRCAFTPKASSRWIDGTAEMPYWSQG